MWLIKKIDLLDKYTKLDKYLIIVDVANPLIKISDYISEIKEQCKSKGENVTIIILSNSFEGNEIIEW